MQIEDITDATPLAPGDRANNANSAPTNPPANNQDNLEVLSYPRAAWEVTRFSLPFTISRVAVAVNVLVNGSITPKIGPNAAAAGPQMISIVYAVLGPGRSILLATGILVGRKHGEVQALLREGNTARAAEIQETIGDQLRQSAVFGTLLGIPSIAFMVGMGPALRASGMDPAIVTEVEGFLNGTATGLLPIFWSTSDQQFAMGIGYKNTPMIFGTLFPLLSMLIGYPLALGTPAGTAGLGYGMSAAAWLSFISLRLYFLRSEFAPYKIYKMQLSGLFNNFTELLKLGLPLGFQALTEWGNLFLLSTLIARKGSNVSMAANGSFQIITAWTLISAALGQGISIKIAGFLGNMRIAEQLGHADQLAILDQNIRRIGNAGITVGAFASVGIMTGLVAMPRHIQTLFVSQNDPEYEDIMIMAQAMLITNAVGLVVDTIRNMSASALSGSKDVLFAPLISTLTMTLMSLSFGALLTEHWNLDANWLFITRDVGILAAAFAVSIRWLMKNYLPQTPAPQTAVIEEIPDNAVAIPMPSTANINSAAGSNLNSFFNPNGRNGESVRLIPGQTQNYTNQM